VSGSGVLTEPVDGADGTLKDGQECIDDPVCEPLSHVSMRTGSKRGEFA
jgi:hypothetical protein